MPRAPQIIVRFHVYSPLTMMGILSVWSFLMSCACCHNSCEFICAWLYLTNIIFLTLSTTSGFYNLFVLSSMSIPELLVGDAM